MQKGDPTQKTFASAKTWEMPALIVAVLASGAAIAAYRTMMPQPSAADYGQTMPTEAVPGATLAIDREEVELGILTVEDVGRADFRLKNTGTEPVEFSQVRTSCMCTFAEIALPDAKSPEFNMAMHNDAATNGWKGVLNPGEEAVVTVVYKPALMPVEGSVARNVKFATNDQQNPVVELGVRATVKGDAAS